MKSNVTVEELNAAAILLTGISVNQLVEVHIAGSIVTAISADEDGNITAHRLLIGDPTTPPKEPTPTEGVDASEDSHEETDGDDGS
jgi:hypothetical protein